MGSRNSLKSRKYAEVIKNQSGIIQNMKNIEFGGATWGLAARIVED